MILFYQHNITILLFIGWNLNVDHGEEHLSVDDLKCLIIMELNSWLGTHGRCKLGVKDVLVNRSHEKLS